MNEGKEKTSSENEHSEKKSSSFRLWMVLMPLFTVILTLIGQYFVQPLIAAKQTKLSRQGEAKRLTYEEAAVAALRSVYTASPTFRKGLDRAKIEPISPYEITSMLAKLALVTDTATIITNYYDLTISGATSVNAKAFETLLNEMRHDMGFARLDFGEKGFSFGVDSADLKRSEEASVAEQGKDGKENVAEARD